MNELGVTTCGDGTAVLFLHGIGSSRVSFADQIAAFSDRYRCIAPDAPGYATSDDPPAPASDPMDMFAEAYESLLGERPTIVVGVSFGGVVATRMGLRQRANLVGLALCDTSRGSGIAPDRAAAMRARPDELATVGARAFADQRAPRLVHTDEPTVIARVADIMAESIRLPGYRYAAEAMAATDHTNRLAEIDVPTLVVVGEYDTICPPAEAHRIATAIAGAELVMIPDAGHLANVEQPAAFNAAIEPFISRVANCDHLERSTK